MIEYVTVLGVIKYHVKRLHAGTHFRDRQQIDIKLCKSFVGNFGPANTFYERTNGLLDTANQPTKIELSGRLRRKTFPTTAQLGNITMETE